MHLILTGATGMVGEGVLQAFLTSSNISKIAILSRRPVPAVCAAKDPGVNLIICRDFGKYDPTVLSQLQGANGMV